MELMFKFNLRINYYRREGSELAGYATRNVSVLHWLSPKWARD
jgi:hypothetical protein